MSATSLLQSVIIFGRDVSKIPCFRNSFLYGTLSGLGSGLVFFLFTSRVKASTDFSVATFAVVTMSYWFTCRYNYSKAKFEMMQAQEYLKQRVLLEGTEEMDKLEKITEPIDV